MTIYVKTEHELWETIAELYFLLFLLDKKKTHYLRNYEMQLKENKKVKSRKVLR